MDDSRRRELRLRVRREVPDAPGVYTWRGADGQCLYVGKSRRLRTRMLSYLGPSATRNDSRIRNLVFAIESFEWQTTAGELMALLIEDARIKQLEPRYNERQRDYRERMYLLLTDDVFPACLVTDGDVSRSGDLWGPFKDEYFCRDLKLILTEEFGLRSCTDPAPYRRSARFDLGQCSGPCRDAVTPAAYAANASAVRAFLDGDSATVVAGVEHKMAEASASLDFERAALLRDRLGFCERFATRQRFFRAFREGRMTVTDSNAGLTLPFERGVLQRIHRAGQPDLLIPPDLGQPVADPRILLDRANILYSWKGLARNAPAAPERGSHPSRNEIAHK